MYYKSNGVKEDEARLTFNNLKNPLYKYFQEAEENTEVVMETIEEELSEAHNYKIEELSLSKRALNACKRSGVETVGELTKLTKEELLALRGVGDTVVDEIAGELGVFGLALKGETPVIRKHKTKKLRIKEDGSYEFYEE